MWMFWEALVGARNEREFSAWREALPKGDRAVLDEKMRALEAFGPGVSFLKGPLGKHRHTYKIRVMGPTKALRPLLCRGPIDNDAELTMLVPMIEVGGKDIPDSAKAEAERRRADIIRDPSLRVRYEVPK